MVWEGDLDDDCECYWSHFYAHAEALDDDFWYCGVYDLSLPLPRSTQQIFHSVEADILPRTGTAARRLAELVMRETQR